MMNTETRKLYRSRDERWIAGVCGGLAKHLGVDPLLMRLMFIVTAEVTAPLYILLWIFVPEGPLE
jgi:phage shock protein PspC (stress-responsive transcriptional regulator)